MNADCFKSLSYEVQKYKFPTNPSYLAGWALGLTTISIVGGQMNNTQPSCVAGQPLNQLTTSGHIQAERSYTPECSCVFYDRLLTNHVSLEITDVLIETSVICCQNSLQQEREQEVVLEQTTVKLNVKENHLGSLLKGCIRYFILNVQVKDLDVP